MCETGRYIDRQAGRQSGRQADRQAGRQEGSSESALQNWGLTSINFTHIYHLVSSGAVLV